MYCIKSDIGYFAMMTSQNELRFATDRSGAVKYKTQEGAEKTAAKLKEAAKRRGVFGALIVERIID